MLRNSGVVNLAHLYELIFYNIVFSKIQFNNQLFSLNNYEHSEDVQRHYLKYLYQFGSEEKLPGFLMTNQEMITFIEFQKGCYKLQNGPRLTYSLKKGNIFNCPVLDIKMGLKMKMKLSIKTEINNGEGEKSLLLC